jgi:hypothetical protein
MFNFTDIVSNILLEQDSIGTPQERDDIHNNLSKIEENAKAHAQETNLVGSGDELINNYLLDLGKRYLGKYDSRVARKRQDGITSKYVDVGYQIFQNLRNIDRKLEEQVTDLNSLRKILQDPALVPNPTNIANIIKQFATTPIENYQCKDPILKSITDADNLSDIALQSLYTKTIYGAVLEMLKKRAGILKAKINEDTLKQMLLYPATYATGNTPIPEPLQETLAENSMHSYNILAIGVAAIEYFKYLVNQQILISKQQATQQQNDSLDLFNLVVTNLLKEETAPSQLDIAMRRSNAVTQQNPEQQNTQQTQKPAQTQQGQRQKFAQTDLLKLIPFNLFDPNTWKKDSNFERIYLQEYRNFITNGVSKYVPGERKTAPERQKTDTMLQQQNIPRPLSQEEPVVYEKPLVYTLDVISKDSSQQAQDLIKALQTIAQFSKTKKTWQQKIGRILSSVVGAIGALRTGMGPVN